MYNIFTLNRDHIKKGIGFSKNPINTKTINPKKRIIPIKNKYHFGGRTSGHLCKSPTDVR